MRQFLPEFFSLPLALLLASVTAASPQGQPDAAKVLDKFFDLGLPEAKGGKWVRISTMDAEDGGAMPGAGNAQYSGNAWLVRGVRGVIEAITSDGRVLRGKKMEGDGDETRDDGDLPPLQIQPANLDGDLKVFTAALKLKESGRFSGDENMQAQMKERIAGGALLFLAQLQRQGRGDFARESLPLVLASVPSPEMALDGAVSLIADSQLASLARAWVEKADAAAYSAGIEKVAATFPRGWKNREAALLLSEGLRAQKPSPLAAESDARSAAGFLLKLKPAQFRELPLGRNWFIHGLNGGPSSEFSGSFPPDDPDETADSARSAKKNSEVAAFFSDKRAAAMALAKLLDDHRYLRTASLKDGNFSRYPRFSFGGRKSREILLREQYDQISRPSELGECAWMLLSQLLPEDVRQAAEEKPEARAASALAWLKTVAGKSDEEVAWDYLRNSQHTYQDEFRGGLSFLVEKGGADTLKKLREVFLDPAVWRGGSVEQVIGPLEKYIRRAPADPAFADKLRAAVKAGLDEQEAERSRYASEMEPNIVRQMKAQRTAQMKRLDQLFKPPQGVAEQLAEIVAMEETEALVSLNAASQSLARRPLSEIEAPIFHAVAKAKPVMLKSHMLQLLLNAAMLGARGLPAVAKANPPAIPHDAATRGAILDLLHDETRVPNEYDPANAYTISDLASWVLIGLHTPQSWQNDWQRMGSSLPHLARKWLRMHALALAGGQPLPPIPNAARLPAGRIEALVAELAALPAAQIPAAFDAKTPDEQFAVAEHLRDAPEWPSSLTEAHFSVSKFTGAKGGRVGAADWRGRRFDAKFAHEIQAAVEESAAAGKPYVVHVTGGEPLAGVDISVRESPHKMPEQQFAGHGFPGVTGKPGPIAFVYFSIQLGGNPGEREAAYGFGFPIWKDAALTRAWRDKYGKSAAEPLGNGNARINPAPFDEKLRACLSLQKDARGIFRIVFSSTSIGAGNSGPGENEN